MADRGREKPVEIVIPFGERFRGVMLAGTKTATSRFKRYGCPGDTFSAFGATFELVAVERRRVLDVLAHEYEREGFCSPEAFVVVWNLLHPRRDSSLNPLVWFHVFRRLPGVKAIGHD